MQGYELQRYKSQGGGHVITESVMRASSLGWSTQLSLCLSWPLKSLPLSSFFKAPNGGDDRVVTETWWERSRAQSGREFDQVIIIIIYYHFLLGTELCLVSDGTTYATRANTLKEICLGEREHSCCPDTGKCSPLPSQPCYPLPQTRTP